MNCATQAISRSPDTLESAVSDPDGNKAGAAIIRETIPAGSELLLEQKVSASSPRLWSTDSPWLYKLASKVVVSGKNVDVLETSFGIRTVKVDAKNGLRLNGKRIRLRGACVHHDNGALGACAYDRAEERRVELLKEAEIVIPVV